jgi:hypothetical protein
MCSGIVTLQPVATVTNYNSKKLNRLCRLCTLRMLLYTSH